MWVIGLALFWLLGAAMEKRSRARQRRAMRLSNRVLPYRLQWEWEDTVFGGMRWLAVVFGAPILLLVVTFYGLVATEGTPVLRLTRLVLITIGLGAGALGVWLGLRADLLMRLLEAEVDPGHASSARRHRVRRFVGILALGGGIVLATISPEVATIDVVVVSEQGKTVAALLPDIVACGFGLAAVGLGLRAFDSCMRLKSSKSGQKP